MAMAYPYWRDKIQMMRTNSLDSARIVLLLMDGFAAARKRLPIPDHDSVPAIH